MDKMRFETVDGTVRNVDKIAEMFPQVVTEVLGENGKLKRAVKWDVLKELLSGDYVEGGECYEFTWPGKRAAIAEAAKPIRKTLRPCKEESKNWDTTENLYIEGDNLEILKLLQESYLGKVKMIYIDPPYNTGNDFVYKDNFTKDKDTSEDELGLFDEETDNRTMSGELFKNTESNGRFHSDWCSMMYPRLQIAKDLLTDDGVIFISIDDNEVENLKKLCDEIFGASNFIAQLIWERAYAPKNDARFISNSHDYVIMFAKSIENFTIGRLPRTAEANARYSNPDNDPRGVWKASDISVKTYNAACDYPITTPSGRVVEPPTGRCWSLSKNAFLERLQDNRIWFGPEGNGTPALKRFLSELKFDGMAPTSIMFYKDVGHSQEGAQEVTKLLDAGVFDGPKPVRLLERVLTLANLKEDSIVLDFFSGSASAAHALIKRNAEKQAKCKFIMVQLPEETGGKASAAGFATICEIGKERIRRAGEKIKAEAGLAGANLDIGFRVFKVADSNMKDVYYSAGEYSQDMLDSLVSNIKEDRTDLDLLYGCLLEWGVELSLPHTSETIDNVTVHTVNNGDLIACFDANIPESAIRTIAKRQPLRAVFRDSSFASTPQKINVEEIFKLLSPTTTVKVI